MVVLIWIHRSKAGRKGAPLKIRITCGPGDKVDISTGKFVDPSLWNVDKKKVEGKSVQADIINKYITSCENKLNKIEADFQDKGLPYNAEIIRNKYLGKHIQNYGLLQACDIHNTDFEEKVGQEDFSEGRLGKYKLLKKRLAHFMQLKYNRTEMFMSELNLTFIVDYWHFQTTTGKEVRGKFSKPMAKSSACCEITMLKKIAKIGFRLQGIYINPFDDFKKTYKLNGKEPLEKNELEDIMKKKLGPRLDRVRDRVIIGCFTGLSDTDIQSCTRDMISTDLHGDKWIDKNRDKSDEYCMIPIWEPTQKLIEKYKDDPELVEKNLVFPQISLQKMNEYLQEIADVCGITKHLTTHVFRYTFANFYINSGGTYENLARILGHADIKTTKGYCKRNRTTIKGETNAVRDKFFGNMKLVEPDISQAS